MNNALSASAWGALQQQADSLLRSGFFPKAIDTSEKAIVIKMYGDLLGIPWVAAMNTINVIQGKPTISPQLMIGLAQRSKLLENMSIEDDGTTCTVVVKRVGQSAHTESFGAADAALMKTTEWTNGAKREISLGEKSNWKQQPKTMRKWRAIAAAFRVVFPDLLLGFYTPEEMGADVAINDEGDMQVVAPPLVVDPNAESRRIASEWAARWKADGVANADLLAALKVKGLLEFDWLADGAAGKADGLMQAYAVENEDEALGIEGAIDNEPHKNAAEAAMENFAAKWIGVGAKDGLDGLDNEDLLMILGVDELIEYAWWKKDATVNADKLTAAYLEKRAATAIKHAASMAAATKAVAHLPKTKTAAKGIGDADAQPPDAENELDKALGRLPKYDKNTDASRL